MGHLHHVHRGDGPGVPQGELAEQPVLPVRLQVAQSGDPQGTGRPPHVQHVGQAGLVDEGPVV